MKALLVALGVSLSATTMIAGAAHAAGASDSEADRTARWNEVRKDVFGDKTMQPGEAVVKLDAPKRADDAALVPITLSMLDKDKVKSVSLIIDDNPTPYAAKFTFGPAADPGEVKLRVRVNNYTDVHAVVESKDGTFFDSKAFVKASGGCSAPMGMSDEEAMKGMGEMRMKFGEQSPGKPTEATLMIRHPNFSGMQMNQVTRDYTPARYIQKLDVSYGDKLIFHLDGDISISSNPVINFAFKPEGQGPIKVVASDNQDGKWEHSFNVPSPSN